MTLGEMTEGWRKAFRKPVPIVQELKFVLDMQTYLEALIPAGDKIELVTKPHQFIVRHEPNADGLVKSSVTCSRWSDTVETAPTHILQRLPSAPLSIKAGRPVFFHRESPSLADCNKRFKDFVDQLDEICVDYKLSGDVRDEWVETISWLQDLETSERRPFTGFWPLNPEQLSEYIEMSAPLVRLPLAPRPDGLLEPIPSALSCTARQAAELQVEIQDKFEYQGLFVRGNGEGHRQHYDARRGNLVVLDNRGQISNGASEDSFLGDWEQHVYVGYVKERISPKNATRKEKLNNEPDELSFYLCEPWAVDEDNEPLMPLWLYEATCGRLVSTAWDDVWHLPWKQVEALPLSVFEAVYKNDFTNTSSATRDKNFMGTGVEAVVRLDLQEGNTYSKGLIVNQPYGMLQYTCVTDPEEKNLGAFLPQEAFECINKQMELVALRKGMISANSSQNPC